LLIALQQPICHFNLALVQPLTLQLETFIAAAAHLGNKEYKKEREKALFLVTIIPHLE
jgi:hypothetical protein